jgi:diaminohydroxyphosphoribosylaminopyrimidine deaminase/5-amino-6-(5-phosphoribosylamino)uracil reductase
VSAAEDARHMAHALALAARGLGNVWPNPAVGCVLVAGGRVVGRGWTQPGGRPHAEVIALTHAGPAAQGATAYVTLEPCAHHGQTGPCAEALVAAGVGRVVSATTDPDPRVAGRGHAILRAAGITVTEGVLKPEAERLNEGFLSRIRDRVPHVTLKLAMSLDGRIANAAGVSKWVTGPAARARVQLMRATHDAVMVGIGTALADDPDLSVRDLPVPRQPVRVVLDSHLRLPATSRLAITAATNPVWVVHAEGVAVPPDLAASAVTLVPCPSDATGRLDITAALSLLATGGLTRILCEGGGGVAASLLDSGHATEIVAFTAGRAFGSSGTPATGPIRARHDLGAPDYRLDRVEAVGADLMHIWRRTEDRS